MAAVASATADDTAATTAPAGPSLLEGLAPSPFDPSASWDNWGTPPAETDWASTVAAFERETGLTADPRCVTPARAEEVQAQFSEWLDNRTYVSAAPSEAWVAQRDEQQRWVDNTYNASHSGPFAMAALGWSRMLGFNETQGAAAVEVGSAIQDALGAHFDAVSSRPSYQQP